MCGMGEWGLWGRHCLREYMLFCYLLYLHVLGLFVSWFCEETMWCSVLCKLWEVCLGGCVGLMGGKCGCQWICGRNLGPSKCWHRAQHAIRFELQGSFFAIICVLLIRLYTPRACYIFTTFPSSGMKNPFVYIYIYIGRGFIVCWCGECDHVLEMLTLYSDTVVVKLCIGIFRLWASCMACCNCDVNV